MPEPLTLTELIQEHFDGVLSTIAHGRWGSWVLDQALAHRGQIILTHEGAGYSVSLANRADWVAIVAGKAWASAADVGELIYAMRDLEYARWLGVLPGAPERNDNAAR